MCSRASEYVEASNVNIVKLNAQSGNGNANTQDYQRESTELHDLLINACAENEKKKKIFEILNLKKKTNNRH